MQACKTGPEVIKRHSNTTLQERIDRLTCGGDVEQSCLGDFDLQSVQRVVGRHGGGEDSVSKARLMELGGRRVDRDGDISIPHVAASRGQHKVGEDFNPARLLKFGDEYVRADPT